MTDRLRLGIVLTGGGARAAYQVGVIKAMAELPVDVVAVSAVGAGALNGAILAGAESTSAAAARLERIWNETILSEQSALRFGPLPVLKLGVYLTLLFGGGVTPEIEERLKHTGTLSRAAARRKRIEDAGSPDPMFAALSTAFEHIHVTTDAGLDEYLSSAFREATVNPRLPFFVSVYESSGGMLDLAKQGLQVLGILEARSPRYIEVSSSTLSLEDRLNAVLASATLPFVCRPTAIDGASFIDGSFAGMRHAPGAVPLQPFRRREEELKLDAVVVVHTEAGTSWDATRFGDAAIIEIRPSADGNAEGVSYFWSNADALRRWIALGATDAQRKLSAVLAELKGWDVSRTARETLRGAAEDL